MIVNKNVMYVPRYPPKGSELENPLDIQEAITESNRQRVKTAEPVARARWAQEREGEESDTTEHTDEAQDADINRVFRSLGV